MISNVYVDGTFKIGTITVDNETASFNLYANGDITGLTKGNVKLVIYGRKLGSNNIYTVLPHAEGNPNEKTVFVDSETYDITLTITSNKNFENASYEINYTEVNQDE